MKKINFRIIELPNHQVLLQKDFSNEDEDDAPELLLMIFYIDGVKCQQTFGYKDEETRDRIFESITDEQAETNVNNALKMFSDDPTPN